MFNISFLGVSSRCHNIDAKLPEILHQKLKYFEITFEELYPYDNEG